MKFLVFMFFSMFMFGGDGDPVIYELNVAPESTICSEDGDNWRCETFNDGGDCVIGLWENGDVSAFGDDC